MLGVNNFLATLLHQGPGNGPLLSAGRESLRHIFQSSSSPSPSSSRSTNLSDITLLAFLKYVGGVTVVTVSVWQTYNFFHSFLPECMTAVLPVTTHAFNSATTKLAKGILNIKDSLVEKFVCMTRKQDDFSRKQDEFGRLQKETHREVVSVKDNIYNLKDSVGNLQSSLDLYEKISVHNAKGVRLVTRAVSSLIPHETELLKEMRQYEKDGHELTQQQSCQSTLSFSNQDSISNYGDQKLLDFPIFDTSYNKCKKYHDLSTEESRLQHVRHQQQQRHASPEREIEIPITQEISSDTTSSIVYDSSNNVMPVLSTMERKGERLEEDDKAFDDIRDMAFIGMTRAAIGVPYGPKY